MDKKKRGQHTKSMNRLGYTKYLELFDAYLDTRSVSESAARVGLNLSTAEKYISRGTVEMPAIRDRIEKMVAKVMEDRADRFSKQVDLIDKMRQNLLVQVFEGVKTVKVLPNGKVKRGEDGSVQEIHISERTASDIVSLLGGIHSLGVDLLPKGVREQFANGSAGPVVQAGATVNVNVGHREAQSEILKNASKIIDVQAKPFEAAIARRLIEEASLRSRA